jgi:hypothetical protein
MPARTVSASNRTKQPNNDRNLIYYGHIIHTWPNLSSIETIFFRSWLFSFLADNVASHDRRADLQSFLLAVGQALAPRQNIGQGIPFFAAWLVCE